MPKWEQFWGEGYDPQEKVEILDQPLRTLEESGKLGHTILDVGSGAHPVSKSLRSGDHKIIEIDIAAAEHGQLSEKLLRLKYDVEELGNDSFATKKALAKTANFLEIENFREAPPEQIDTIIFSEILNYVDYQKVIAETKTYLKPGGRVIIFNAPGRGHRFLFSDEGVSNNAELISYMESQGFTIESTNRDPEADTLDNQESRMLLLVAQKI